MCEGDAVACFALPDIHLGAFPLLIAMAWLLVDWAAKTNLRLISLVASDTAEKSCVKFNVIS